MNKSITTLSKNFESLSIEERIERIFCEFAPERVLVTSSFGTSSALLLHLINRIRPGHPIYFLDTGFHFEATWQYLQQLEKMMNLNIKIAGAPENKNQFTASNFTYRYNQDLCCYINKVEPMALLKQTHDVWLSGLFRYQNANRQNFKFFEEKEDIIKSYPVLDMTAEEVHTYYFIHEIPNHPLISKGYDSVGCTHCTTRGEGRAGRWSGSVKSECGLHS
jgi:phosphoadenosine phosphosulfate reductase